MKCHVLGTDASLGQETLGELWTRMTPAERGPGLLGLKRFPLLTKFIFTAQKLSIQVHPDDTHARRYEGEPWGKTEVWYVVDAKPGAWVRVGVKPGIPLAKLRPLFGKHEIEDCLNYIALRAGEVVYVPAGTIHTIGPGLCLCEVQQYSDITYRIYDYDRVGLDGRKRPLHLEKALAVVRPEAPEAGRVVPVPLTDCKTQGQVLVASPYFVVEKHGIRDTIKLVSDSSHFDLVVFSRGKGTLSSGSNQMNYVKGDSFLVFANAGRAEVRPSEASEFLRLYVVSSPRATETSE